MTDDNFKKFPEYAITKAMRKSGRRWYDLYCETKDPMYLQMLHNHYRRCQREDTADQTGKMLTKYYAYMQFEIYRDELKQGKMEGAYFQEEYDRMQKLRNVRNRPGRIYFWCTINFDPLKEVTVAQATKRIHKMARSKYCRELWYTHEQRGEDETELGKGHHIHFLFKQTGYLPNGKIKERVQGCFKHTVGNPLSSHFINVKPLPHDSWAEDKISYLKGDKWDKEKELKVRMDRVWRNQNNLENIYHLEGGSFHLVDPPQENSP